MENFMAGLARFAIRFRYAIIAFWVVAGALCLTFFPSLSSAVNTDNSSFLPGSSPSVHALHLAAPFQPVNDTTGTLVVLGKAKPQQYVDTTWSWVHRVTSYSGAAAFGIAGAAGAMFLLASRRLRHKTPANGPALGSLERLERITYSSVTLGFALLTIGLVTGIVRVLRDGGSTKLGEHWFASPKVVGAFAVWIVYAIVLHSPINPRFRGRKVAVLSIVGLVLMIGTLVAVNFMPTGSPQSAAATGVR